MKNIFATTNLNQNELNQQVEEVILDMINNESFGEFIKHRLEQKIDVSALEEEREQLRQQLRHLTGAKKKTEVSGYARSFGYAL